MVETIYEDEDLVAVNKPSGIALLQDRHQPEHLLPLLKSQFGPCYLVHRIDKGTSGVLLVARNQSTQSKLTKAFAKRRIHKFYLAQCTGAFPQGQTFGINLPLRKGRKSRYRVAGLREHIVCHNHQFTVQQEGAGVHAQTLVRGLLHSNGTSVVLAKPITGRTHQIRVHLAWIGHPITNDTLYNKHAAPTERLMLHCHKLLVPGYPPFRCDPPRALLAIGESSA